MYFLQSLQEMLQNKKMTQKLQTTACFDKSPVVRNQEQQLSWHQPAMYLFFRVDFIRYYFSKTVSAAGSEHVMLYRT